MNYRDIKRERTLNSQMKKLIKREEKFFYRKENEYIKNKILPIKEQLEEKIPRNIIETFEKAFEKGFYYVFEKGTMIIEKSYNSEKLKNEADIDEYILSKQMNTKNLTRIDKRVKKSVLINKGITTAEGAILGILGVGIPDIPVFIGIILRTVYEICINYGFDYDSEEEKAFILSIICASSIKTDEKFLYSKEIDRIAHDIDNKNKCSVDIKKLIETTSKSLSENIVLSKIIQGVPIVGVYGGISNYLLLRDISEVASIKYKKRLLHRYILY